MHLLQKLYFFANVSGAIPKHWNHAYMQRLQVISPSGTPARASERWKRIASKSSWYFTRGAASSWLRASWLTAQHTKTILSLENGLLGFRNRKAAFLHIAFWTAFPAASF
jgi:hypothetical protein